MVAFTTKWHQVLFMIAAANYLLPLFGRATIKSRNYVFFTFCYHCANGYQHSEDVRDFIQLEKYVLYRKEFFDRHHFVHARVK